MKTITLDCRQPHHLIGSTVIALFLSISTAHAHGGFGGGFGGGHFGGFGDRAGGGAFGGGGFGGGEAQRYGGGGIGEGHFGGGGARQRACIRRGRGCQPGLGRAG